MSTKTFSLIDRIKSFKYAGRGVWTMLKSQQNAWIHALATIIVLILGMFCKLHLWEWSLIILSIMVVWMSEALNTALEFLADVTSPDYNPLIAKAKDVAAGAVLISAIGAAIIGILIMGPDFIEFIF